MHAIVSPQSTTPLEALKAPKPLKPKTPKTPQRPLKPYETRKSTLNPKPQNPQGEPSVIRRMVFLRLLLLPAAKGSAAESKKKGALQDATTLGVYGVYRVYRE